MTSNHSDHEGILSKHSQASGYIQALSTCNNTCVISPNDGGLLERRHYERVID
jgi:hypothetical protein